MGLLHLVLLAVPHMPMVAHCAEQDDPTGRILADWQSLRDRLQSAHVKWRVETTYVKGGLTRMANAMRPPSLANRTTPAIMPAVDTRIESSHEMIAKAGMIRYDYDDIRWSLKDSTYSKKPSRASLVDGHTAHHYPQGLGDGTVRQGKAGKVDYLIDALQPHAYPLILFAVPYPRNHADLKLREYETITTSRIDDKTILLCCVPRDRSSTLRVTCDASRFHIVTRIVELDDSDREERFYQIDYSATRDGFLYPSSWIARQSFAGGLQYEARATVDEYTPNKKLDDSTFQLEHDFGTVVMDNESGIYIVRQDGSRQTLTQTELTMPYSDLIKSLEPGGPWRKRAILMALALQRGSWDSR